MSQRPIIEKFPQIDHRQATGKLGVLYEDIECTLRAPWVAFAIRVMSQFEHFVPAAWAALKPQISTRYAEQGADKVREAAIIPGPAPADPTPALRASGWSEGQIVTLDALNYGNPKYRFIADMTVAMIRLKQAFGGAEDATKNKLAVWPARSR